MIAQLKSYFFIALGFIGMGFLAVFKYRGAKIESQQEEIKQHKARHKADEFVSGNREAAARAEAVDTQEIEDGKVIL